MENNPLTLKLQIYICVYMYVSPCVIVCIFVCERSLSATNGETFSLLMLLSTWLSIKTNLINCWIISSPPLEQVQEVRQQRSESIEPDFLFNSFSMWIKIVKYRDDPI